LQESLEAWARHPKKTGDEPGPGQVFKDVPPPWVLRPSLELLRTKYASMVDATTGFQLFTDETHKLWDRMLQEVDDWWLSGRWGAGCLSEILVQFTQTCNVTSLAKGR
jgi:hypothetical protein